MYSSEKIADMLNDISGLSQTYIDRIADNSHILTKKQKIRILRIIENKIKKVNKNENIEENTNEKINENEVSVRTITVSRRKNIIKIVSAAACMLIVCMAALSQKNGTNNNPPKVSQDSDIYVKITEAETTQSNNIKNVTVTTAVKQKSKDKTNNGDVTSSITNEPDVPVTSSTQETPATVIQNEKADEKIEKKADVTEVSAPSESEIKQMYKDILDKQLENRSYKEYIYLYYDMNNDGISELITASCKNDDYSVSFYTIKNNQAVCVGEYSQDLFTLVSVDNNTGRIVFHGKVKQSVCCVSYAFDGDTVKETDSINNNDVDVPLKYDSNINDYDYSDYENEINRLFDLQDVLHGYLFRGNLYAFVINHPVKTEPYYYFMDEAKSKLD